MESLLAFLNGMSLKDRSQLVEQLVEDRELDQVEQRKSDEEFVRELLALHYEGEPSAEELKEALRASHCYNGREINYEYNDGKR